MMNLLTLSKITYLFVFIVLSACAHSATAPELEGSEDDVNAILAVFAEWGRARDAGDVDGVVAVHHEDMLIMTREKAIYRGHSGVRQFYADNYNTDSNRKLYNQVMEVRALGELAIVIGKFLVIDTSNSIEDPGYYLIVLKKNDDDKWKIFRDIDTPSPDGLSLKD